MIPIRPFLLRAVYEWALENSFTPHILVNAKAEGVNVPASFVRDGQITLNIHPNAVRDLALGNDRVAFSARFNGAVFAVDLPVSAVLAAFARENGRGVFFQDEQFDTPSPPPSEGAAKGTAARRRPSLKVVK